MTKPQQKYFVLAILTLLTVAGVIIGDYLGDYPLISPASLILSLFMMWIARIIYKLLQFYYFKTVRIRKSYNWFSLIVMFILAILELWYGETDLLFGFPQYLVLGGLCVFFGITGFFKIVPKYSSKQRTK